MATPSYFQLLCTTTLLVLYIFCLLCTIPWYIQLLRTISFLHHPSRSKFPSILITNYITLITVGTPLQYSTTHSSQRDIVKPISFSQVHNTHNIHLQQNLMWWVVWQSFRSGLLTHVWPSHLQKYLMEIRLPLHMDLLLNIASVIHVAVDILLSSSHLIWTKWTRISCNLILTARYISDSCMDKSGFDIILPVE